MEHHSNGSLSNYVPSTSPSSSSDSTLSPTIINLNHNSLPLSKTMINIHSPPNVLSNHNAFSLPHKLRHKAKPATNDSDSASDSGNVSNENLPNHNGNTNGNCIEHSNNFHDSPSIRSENYTLRNELQRLASEVASLKNVLVCAPGTYSMSSGCNTSQGESRSCTPHTVNEIGDLNDSQLLANRICVK